MSADTFILDGHAYSWRRVCELRRQQLAERRKVEGMQAVLFELHEDHRPASERTAAGRYREPSLLSLMQPHASDGHNGGQNCLE